MHIHVQVQERGMWVEVISSQYAWSQAKNAAVPVGCPVEGVAHLLSHHGSSGGLLAAAISVHLKTKLMSSGVGAPVSDWY